MCSNISRKHFVLTGPPGIGKTTIVKSVCAMLKQIDVPIIGFYTEEVRENRQRIGFDIVSFDGNRGPLARATDSATSKYKVGKYSVYVDKFETIVLPIFQKVSESPRSIIVIDEIGKMELFSNKYIAVIESLFKNKEHTIIATIPIAKGKPIPVVESIRSDKNNYLINVDLSNRDQATDMLFNEITRI